MIGTKSRPPQRFLLALGLSLLAGGCGGGGGGGGGGSPANAAPTLVTAAYVGSGAPTAGEALLLAFSEPIAVAVGTLLTDDDVTLSGGGSLGAVAALPTVLGDNTVQIVLGSGVSFTPGVTTITLRTRVAASGGTPATGNDCIVDASGQLGIAATPIPIGTSDGANPVLSNLTIAAIDSALNGTGAAGGILQVPANGWNLDLTFSDNTAVTPSATVIIASVAVATASGTQLAGTNLTPFLTQLSSTSTTATWRVPTTVTFPAGLATLSGRVVDASGLTSGSVSLGVTVRPFTDNLRPFETTVNPSQVWFLDFSRDVESFSTSSIAGGAAVDVIDGSNGIADCEDVLRVLGLFGSPATGTDSTVLQIWKNAILAELASFYANANISFTLTQPGASFGSGSSVPYSSFGYSAISIAGASSSAGVLGVAIFDPNNTTQNDNTRTNFSGIRLGVFLHTIVDSGFGPPSTSTFRLTYGPFAPALGGTPIGNDGQDAQRLAGSLQDARADDIDAAIADFARFTAVVTAHECGHSLGLVVNGAMPVGLYGNDQTNFPGSADGHIRTAALFPAGATNIMSPSLSYTGALNPATAFNSLNLAYLREQVYYGN
jgi:hypothetical protein